MIRRLTAVVVVLSAFAQPSPAAKPSPARPKEQKIIFDSNDLIEGGRLGPAIEDIYVKPPTQLDSLIRRRLNFNDKLMESASKM